MSTEKTVDPVKSVVDMLYANTPELHAQLAQVASAWNATGISKMQSKGLNHAAQEMVDLNAERTAALDKLAAVPVELRTPEILQLMNDISVATQVDAIRVLAGAIDRTIAQAKNEASVDKGLNDNQNRAQENYERMMAEVARLEKEVRDAMNKATAAGYIDQDDNKKSEEEQKEIDSEIKKIAAMPEGPEKEKAKKALAKRIVAHAENDISILDDAIAAAEKNGDYKMAQQLREAKEKKEHIKEYQKEELSFNPGLNKVNFEVPNPHVDKKEFLASSEEVKLGELPSPKTPHDKQLARETMSLG